MEPEVSSSDSQYILGKNYTIGALAFHSLILLGFALGPYRDLLTPGTFPVDEGAQITIIAFGVMAIIGFLLTIKHHRDTMSKENLKRWATLHIFVSFYALTQLFTMPMIMPAPNTQIDRFGSFLLILIYLIPSLPIYAFAGWEER